MEYSLRKPNEALGVGQNLTEFSKIPMPESLKFYNFFKKKKINTGIFRILIRFNEKF
jgi:hypothetical protein